MHEGVQRALSSPLSTSYNGSASPPVRANSAGAHACHVRSTSDTCLPLSPFCTTPHPHCFGGWTTLAHMSGC